MKPVMSWVHEALTVEEQVHSVLVTERLHGDTHLLKLLVAGVSGIPTTTVCWHEVTAICILVAASSHVPLCLAQAAGYMMTG